MEIPHNPRETSFEALAESFQNCDEIYNLVDKNPRVTIFRPKIAITQRDIEQVPNLAQLRTDISNWEAALREAKIKGSPEAYVLKRTIIQMRKDQYLLKQEFRHPVSFKTMAHSNLFSTSNLEDTSYFDLDSRTLVPRGASLASPEILGIILCNYSALKEDSWEALDSDLHWLLIAFDNLAERALAQFPIYESIVTLKIDGVSNKEISDYISDTYKKRYTPAYISTIWRKKIPQIIALAAVREYTTLAFKHYHLPFKKCGRCHQLKPASPLFFTHNSSSKDTFYSICKNCRAKGKKM